MFVHNEEICGVCRKEPVETGGLSKQKTEEHSFRVEHRVEGTSKRMIRLETQEV